MGNQQTSSTENAESHSDNHKSISKTIGRGKNFMRLGRKRLSGNWDATSSKVSCGNHSVESEFSHIFPSVSLERHSIASADVCRDIAGVKDDESSYTKHRASNINNNNNNNNINGKEDEEETEINRFVSSLTGNNKITSLHQKQIEKNSIESAALRDESVDKNGVIDFNQSNCNNATSNNNTKKLSAFNCDTADKKSAFERESDSIFVQTESWTVAKTYTDAIKHRRDSTLLDKSKSPSRESIVIRQYQPPHSSSSDSNFTDPQTLLSPDLLGTDGFITEINECYYSDSSDQDKNVINENIIDKLSITKNESINIVSECVLASHDKKLNLSVEKLHKINIIDVSPLIVEKLDAISIFDNSFELIVGNDSDEESSVTDDTMKSNKITPLSVSNRSPPSKGSTPRINTSTSGSLFNVSRVKKVELTNLNKNGTTDRAPKSTGSSGNVLRKVASITATVNTDKKQLEITKPSFVPEKLNFAAFEKFEGQMLINWFQSTLGGGNTNTELSSQPNRLIQQCCTNLLVAGVIKQIPDEQEEIEDIFKPNLMYQWTYTESHRSELLLPPGKLNSSDIWPHSPLPTLKMPSIMFNSTPKPEKVHPEISEVKAIINKCETIDELCNTMQKLLLQDSANMRISNTNNRSMIIKEDRVNNLTALNNNNNDHSASDGFVTASASMFESNLEEMNLSQESCNTIQNNNEKSNPVETKSESVQTESLDEKTTTTNDKEVQTENEPVKVDPEIKPEIKKEPEKKPAPSIPPPPPPMNMARPAPMPVPCPIPKPLSSNGIPKAPIPPAPTGEPPNIMCPPPLPLPSKQSDWQTTINLRKPIKNPPKPMKPLFWTRIVTKVPPNAPSVNSETDTVDVPEVPETEKPSELWQEIDETSLDNLDEFTELFSRQVVIPKQKSRDNKERPAKIETLKVLDSKRSQTVGIFARSLHVAFEEIEHAIYHCDTSVVSLETLQHIMSIKATPDELAQIKDASVDVALDAPEKFLLQISQISCFSERISCIVLQAEFDEAVSTVSRKLETIIRLCTFMMESENLKIIFSIILTLGNYMNGGNRTRGQADGFGLEILGKLKDVKSKDSKITLLHFIVKTFIQQARKSGTLITELVLPIPDPTDIDKSSNVDFEDCKQQVNSLQTKLNHCRKTIDIVVNASGDSANPFKEKMDAFLEEATLRLKNKVDKLEKSKKVFVQVLAFYKFNPKSGTLDESTPSQFFELWTPFTHDFRDIWIKEIDALTNEILKKSKRTKEAVKYTKKPSSTSQSTGKPPSKLKQRMNELRNRDN